MVPESRILSRSYRRWISSIPSTYPSTPSSLGCSSSSSSRWRTYNMNRFYDCSLPGGYRSFHTSRIIFSSIDDLQLIVTKAAAKVRIQ